MIGVIYWSGTGNTQAMAEAIGKGIADAGQEVVVKSVSKFPLMKRQLLTNWL